MNYSLHDMKPFIGIPVNRDFPWQTTISVAMMTRLLEQRKRPYEFELMINGTIITKTRSMLIGTFLRTDCTHCVFIDSDMSWDPAGFLRLLAMGTVMDVVAVAYLKKEDPPIWPVNMKFDGLRSNEHGCLPIVGTGLGFTIVRREFIEALAKKCTWIWDEQGEYPMMFRTGIKQVDGKNIFAGEDILFFEDLAAVGAKVWLDPSIVLGHVGGKEWRGKFASKLKSLAEAVAEGVAPSPSSLSSDPADVPQLT